MESQLSHPSPSLYLKEAATPVCEAAGGIPRRWAGGHVVFLSTGPGNSCLWVCVLRLGRRLQGPELCGSKTHFSCGATREEIPALATDSIMEVLVCWNAFIVTVCLLSPLSSCFLNIHLLLLSLSYLLHLSLFPLSLPPSVQIIVFILFFYLIPTAQLIFGLNLRPLITCLDLFPPSLTFSLSFFSLDFSHVLIHT